MICLLIKLKDLNQFSKKYKIILSMFTEYDCEMREGRCPGQIWSLRELWNYLLLLVTFSHSNAWSPRELCIYSFGLISFPLVSKLRFNNCDEYMFEKNY